MTIFTVFQFLRLLVDRVQAAVRVAAQDRAERERLLRYCAHPMFAGERLVWASAEAQVRYGLPWAPLQGTGSGSKDVLNCG